MRDPKYEGERNEQSAQRQDDLYGEDCEYSVKWCVKD